MIEFWTGTTIRVPRTTGSAQRVRREPTAPMVRQALRVQLARRVRPVPPVWPGRRAYRAFRDHKATWVRPARPARRLPARGAAAVRTSSATSFPITVRATSTRPATTPAIRTATLRTGRHWRLRVQPERPAQLATRAQQVRQVLLVQPERPAQQVTTVRQAQPERTA